MAFILFPAFTSPLGKSFPPLPTSAEVSCEESRRLKEASITLLYIHPKSLGCLMQSETGGPISDPICRRRFQFCRDSAVFGAAGAQSGGGVRERKQRRLDTCGMDGGNNFPGRASVRRRALRCTRAHGIDERSHRVVIKNSPPVRRPGAR